MRSSRIEKECPMTTPEKELVLIKPIGSKLEPYTTADKVAEFAQVQHKHINRLIQLHEKDLSEFGLLRFENEAAPGQSGTKYRKIYYLNEQQATLLITYLKNTPPVRAFKKALVRSFFEARREIDQRKEQRAIKAPVRRALTDAIRDSGENERMHGHAFAAYTNLIYKASVGKTATQLRKEGGKDALQMLDAESLAAVTKREAQVCTLLDCGMGYNEIRAVLTREKGA